MKNIAIPIGLVVTLIGVAVGYGALQNKTENTKEVVVELKKTVETAKEEIDENEKIDLRQSIILENITEQLLKIDKKLDKDLER